LSRAYAKWAVSYDRDGSAFYAAVIHENPENWAIHQENANKSPYPNETKWDHFLVKAFDDIAPYFSQATTQAIHNALDLVHEYALATMPKAPRALGGARLVKKGGG
jgi:hypothetical protein